jgi:hypothetical protein
MKILWVIFYVGCLFTFVSSVAGLMLHTRANTTFRRETDAINGQIDQMEARLKAAQSGATKEEIAALDRELEGISSTFDRVKKERETGETMTSPFGLAILVALAGSLASLLSILVIQMKRMRKQNA